MSKESDFSFLSSFRKIIRAYSRFNIIPEDYVGDQLWKRPDDRLKSYKKNRFAKIVAKERGISYAEALSLMREIKDQYDISFNEFVLRKFYEAESEEALHRRARKFQKSQRRHIKQAAKEAGWTIEEAERRMREVKDRHPAICYRKFVGYGFYKQTDEEIAARVKKWGVDQRKWQDQAMEATGWLRSRTRDHMSKAQLVYNIIPAYYSCYKAWELTDEQMASYATQNISVQLSRKYNRWIDIRKIGDKANFNKVFSEFTNRKYWVNQDSTFEEFLNFSEGLESAFCKPLRSGGGLGVFTLDLSGDEKELSTIYDDLMSKPLILVEEYVRQHSEISEFYPGSVNTIRVVALEDKEGNSHIISAGIRFGQHGIADNFSSGGMVADVDIATGRILTPAVDKEGAVHEVHPYSGKKFEGFQIPLWEEVMEMAVRALSVLDGVNYAGWDFAVCEDKVCIIEYNSEPDLVLVQAPYAPQKIGKRYLFEPYM